MRGILTLGTRLQNSTGEVEALQTPGQAYAWYIGVSLPVGNILGLI